MANEKELSILIKMRADIDAAIKKVNDSLDSVGKKSHNSSDGMVKGFKKALQPINDVRLAFVRLSLTIGFFAGVAKLTNELAKEIQSLDSSSFILGTTTEELSRKMYGFNIATDKAKIGISTLNILSNDLKKIWEGVKVKTAEWVFGWPGQGVGFLGAEAGNIASGGKAFGWDISKAWKFAGEDIKQQNQEIKENSEEVLQVRGRVENELRRMKLSTYEYQKVLLAQEVNDMRAAGVSEVKLRQYQAAREQELLQQRFGFKRFTDFMDDQFRSTITSMKGTMSGFINDAFHGSLQSGKEYFAQFGNSILKMFSDIIAEMIARWAMLKLFGLPFHSGGMVGGGKKFVDVKILSVTPTGGFGGGSSGGRGAGGSFHSGGMIRAHSGWDEVPIIAQSGEAVLSRRGVGALGEDNINLLNRGQSIGSRHVTIQPVVVIQAWDAQDVMRNKNMISAVIHDAVTRNATIRDTLRRYT